MRPPRPTDGAAVSALVAACPPLDHNSLYATLLLCSDFAGSCIVAELRAELESEREGPLVGWVSGYRPPTRPEELFIWQVAVAGAARGEGLARRMIEGLLRRPEATGVTCLVTTITSGNAASWALFGGLARRWRAPFSKIIRFERDRHLAGRHDSEWQVRIGPIPRSGD